MCSKVINAQNVVSFFRVMGIIFELGIFVIIFSSLMHKLTCKFFFITVLFVVAANAINAGDLSSSKKKKKKQIDKVILTAKGYLGTKYKYGGTSRSGMDCSGLMLNAFTSVNISLPRTSINQSKEGRGVSLSNVQKGDLVFFALGKKKKKITHVGLITEVRGRKNIKFIHASSSRGVVESNLMQDYYKKRIIKCRRII